LEQISRILRLLFGSIVKNPYFSWLDSPSGPRPKLLRFRDYTKPQHTR